jgi:RNA-directed DNA polymerase
MRLKVAGKSIQRFKAKLRMLFRSGRGRSIRTTIAMLAPKLRGWVIYFRYAGVKGIFEELDGWIRRHLRKILWRQWKRPVTRARWLMRLGLSEVRSCTSASNGRGPWWNSGASHLNQALPKKFFDRLELVSLMDHYHRLKCAA